MWVIGENLENFFYTENLSALLFSIFCNTSLKVFHKTKLFIQSILKLALNMLGSVSKKAVNKNFDKITGKHLRRCLIFSES